MMIKGLPYFICFTYPSVLQLVQAVSPITPSPTLFRSSNSELNKFNGNGRLLVPVSKSTALLHNLRGGEEEEGGDTESEFESGSESESEDESSSDEGDEERYSRQFYTLGARAHSLVRTSSIVIDGPARSGLVYEAVKNLALSGVGKIILLTSNDEIDNMYFNEDMDDLGGMYRRGAMAECMPEITINEDDKTDVDDVELMVEYIRRLNPGVKVYVMERSRFLSVATGTGGDGEDDGEYVEMCSTLGNNPVLLCVDRPLSTQLSLNYACRNPSSATSEKDIHFIPFVSIETAGVYGKAFCDFGNDFHVIDEDGETPKACLLERVEKTEGGGKDRNGEREILIHCIEGERHDVSKGDRIEFQWKNGSGGQAASKLDNKECVVVYVKNPICFTAKFCSKNIDDQNEGEDSTEIDELISAMNEDANGFSRVKIPKAVPFLSLREALEVQDDPSKDVFAASDLDKSFDPIRRKAIMLSFAALETIVKGKSSIPSHDDVDEFVAEVKKSIGCDGDDDVYTSISSSFAKFAKAKFTPLQAIYGALGAQEALKAASGLYNPIKQFLLYDCDEVLNGVKSKKTENESVYMSGMRYILGKKLMKKLSAQKIFVVGSGAIGCEVLKNLAAMDVGTRKSKGGSIILTDMDTIEKSNLSRQLLFRDSDVGKFKSVAAQEAMQRLNPRVQIDTHTSKVGDDSKGSYFDDRFWSKGVDVVLNALDNVEARLFIDSQCVANKKAMIDAGTLGAKGNVQVVVPGQSESYGSSVDPPEPTIPVCTLKNFPYEISHTIQWGRDLFDGLFTRRPAQVNEYMPSLSSTSEGVFAKALFGKLGEDAAIELANELDEDCQGFDPEIEDYAAEIKSSSLKWASHLAKKLFYNAMEDLLRQHPLDSLDDDDEPFWTGTRKAPIPLNYSEEDVSPEQQKVNDNIVNFVRQASRLRIETYLSADFISGGDMLKYSSVTVEEAKAELRKTIDDSAAGTKRGEDSFQKHITTTIYKAKSKLSQIKEDLNVASFEKDDDTNGHVAFVTAASNLRAIAYGITPVDAMETRRVAGNIVPAMITTTAFVSALSCIELVKLAQHSKLYLHRNAFVNLALPFFAFTSPMPAEEISGLHGTSHNIWDRIVVKESEKSHSKGGITLRRLLRQIKKKSPLEKDEVEVSNISYGPYMLYANFLHEDDDSVLDKPVIELVIDAISSGDIEDEEGSEDEGEISYTEAQLIDIEALKRRAFVDFAVLVEDSVSGEEAELPPVRLSWYKKG